MVVVVGGGGGRVGGAVELGERGRVRREVEGRFRGNTNPMP